MGEPGAITVVDTERLQLVDTVATEGGAHTIGLDPSSHTIYAFLPANEGAAVYVPG